MTQQSPTKAATTRTRLSLSTKLDIAKEIRTGTTFSSLISKYKVGRRTLTRIKKESERLSQLAKDNEVPLDQKTIRPVNFPELEKRLLLFVSVARTAKLPVSLSVLIAKALFIRDEILSKCNDNDNEKGSLKQFSASRGWAISFVRRHSLRSVALHGEAGSLDASAAAEPIRQLCDKLREYDIGEIYNVDDTGLFFKLLPRKTYVINTAEGRKSLRDVKSMGGKDRVTGYICTNADGSDKLPMAIIGKAENPRCFRAERPAVPYFSQKNAWSDTATFRKWFFDFFLPHIRCRTSKKVILLMDNCGPHGTDLRDPRNQVSILTLPPNCTAIHQPMGVGIISTWKQHYRSLLLQNLLLDVETRAQRKESNKGVKAGMKGINEGYDPHLLDVSKMAQQSWDRVSSLTIARCWVKSKILPLGIETELTTTFGPMGNENQQWAREVLDQFKKLSISVSTSDTLCDPVYGDINENDIAKWVTVEEDLSVREAMVSDAYEESFRVISDPTTNVATVDNVSDDADGEAEPPMPLPPISEIRALMKPVEDLAYDCNVSDAIFFLRKAHDAIVKAAKSRSLSATRQT